MNDKKRFYQSKNLKLLLNFLYRFKPKYEENTRLKRLNKEAEQRTITLSRKSKKYLII